MTDGFDELVKDLEAENEELRAKNGRLLDALKWAVIDGRGHGISACVCVQCKDAKATLKTAQTDGSPSPNQGET